MNNRCWGFRGAEVMLPRPSFSLRAMSALALIRERGTPRYLWTPAMSISGISCPNTRKWGCGLTIHIFLSPSTSICSKAGLLSSPGLTSKPLSQNSAARSLSGCWRPPDVMAINAMSAVKAPAFTLNSPTSTPS